MGGPLVRWLVQLRSGFTVRSGQRMENWFRKLNRPSSNREMLSPVQLSWRDRNDIQQGKENGEEQDLPWRCKHAEVWCPLLWGRLGSLQVHRISFQIGGWRQRRRRQRSVGCPGWPCRPRRWRWRGPQRNPQCHRPCPFRLRLQFSLPGARKPKCLIFTPESCLSWSQPSAEVSFGSYVVRWEQRCRRAFCWVLISLSILKISALVQRILVFLLPRNPNYHNLCCICTAYLLKNDRFWFHFN